MVPGAVAPAFIPVHQPPAEPAPADIRIELRRGTTAISVSWPVDARAVAMIRIDAFCFTHGVSLPNPLLTAPVLARHRVQPAQLPIYRLRALPWCDTLGQGS